MPRLFAARACTERLRIDAWNYPWVAPTGSDRLRAVPRLCSLWLCSPKLAEELPQKMPLRSNTWMRKQHGRNREAACCVTITGVNTEGYILPTRFYKLQIKGTITGDAHCIPHCRHGAEWLQLHRHDKSEHLMCHYLLL